MRPQLKVLRLRLLMRLVLRLLRLILRRLMLVMLRVLVMLMRLVLLFARIERLRLAWRERLAAHLRLIAVAIVVTVIGDIAARAAARLLLLVIGLALAKLFLRGGDQAEIMFGVLIIIFGSDRIPGALRVTG